MRLEHGTGDFVRELKGDKSPGLACGVRLTDGIPNNIATVAEGTGFEGVLITQGERHSIGKLLKTNSQFYQELVLLSKIVTLKKKNPYIYIQQLTFLVKIS